MVVVCGTDDDDDDDDDDNVDGTDNGIRMDDDEGFSGEFVKEEES